MDETHRKLILDNIDELVLETDYDVLLDACFTHKIFPEVIRNRVDSAYGDLRHYALFHEVTKRGPTAFDAFLKALSANNYVDAFRRLKGISVVPHISNQLVYKTTSSNNTTRSNSIPNKTEKTHLKPYTKDITIGKSVIKATSIQKNSNTSIGEYKMNGPQWKRGIVFIINIINFQDNCEDTRVGADIDRENLLSLFYQLGFTIFYEEDISKSTFQAMIPELFEYISEIKPESFMFILMSHGNKEEEVSFNCGALMKVQKIIELFSNNTKCLRNVPKCLFFPFCRGTSQDSGVASHAVHTKVTVYEDGVGVRPRNDLPTISDMMVCHGTLWNRTSFRDDSVGSWYIEAMCEVFISYAHNHNLEELLKRLSEKLVVKRSTKDKLQSATYTNILHNKVLYLNPGISLADDGETITHWE